MAQYVTVTLDLDAELVPGRTKAALRALATRPTPADAVPFSSELAEQGIAARNARKAAAKAAA
jgi:hypothetical protein